MSNIILTLVIDVMMAVLLLVTLFYCRKLNARITVLQDAKSELGQIIREFDESTQRATKSIAEIHEATNRINENMQHKIDKANFLADDLQFLIDRSAKALGKPEVAQAASSSTRMQMPRTAPREFAQSDTPAAAPNNPPEAITPARSALRVRSKAEQELLDALKTRG